jgi:predicted phage terminase large subunit-like protein
LLAPSNFSTEVLRRLPPAQVELQRRRIEAQRRDVERRGDEIRKNCETFSGFVKEAWHVVEPIHPLRWGWALDAMAEHVDYALQGQILRLLMNVPPGMMKSLMVCVFAQAWEWGPAKRPGSSYLSASWNGDFATRDSRKTRDLLQSAWYQSLWPNVKLTRTAEDDFANSSFGTRVAKPFVGLTSGRADRLVWDDPHSTEKAESDAEIARATRVLRESVPTRINDPVRSIIIGIMQRLRENDCSGVIEQLGLNYTRLVLPMEFEPERRCHTVLGLENGQTVTFTDPRTEEGELLFPERFPRDVVERDKLSLGEYGTAGQFQQRPVPREGGEFKRHWFEIIETCPAGGRFTRAWDLAATKGGGDWTVGVLMKMLGGIYYVLDVVRLQGSPAEVDSAIKTQATQDAAFYGKRDYRVRLPQDPGAAGKSQKASHSALLDGFTFSILPVTGDKVTRARPLASQAGAGNVKILKGPWNTVFLDELCTFPNAFNDDQVDAVADAYNDLVSTAPTGGIVAMPIIVTGSRPSPG